MTPTPIARELYDAYRSTRYIAWIDGEAVVLRVGSANQVLAALMAAHGVSAGCFVTGFNPYSKIGDRAVNAAANARLQSVLLDAGYLVFEAEGRALDDAWPAEPSYLVLGCCRQDALGLCMAFDQNAVLCFGADATPEIVLHPHLEKPQ